MPHVMLVDDQLETLALIRTMLERNGFTVSVVASGSGALQMLDKKKVSAPDIFILDIAMPGMNGLELLRKLRLRPKSSRSPVMMLTAISEPEVKQEALALGAGDFVVKPVLASVLVQKVNRLLQ